MSVCELNNHNTLDLVGQKLAQSNILYYHSLERKRMRPHA